jgi:hypothetical protein
MATSAEVVTRPSKLYTSNRLLDDFLGGLEPAKLTFINSGSSFVHHLVFQLCVRHILDFDREIVYVDGGNSINPYTIATIARKCGRARHEMLGRIRVARAFTAYQMATILLESLEEELRAGPGFLVLSCLPDLFLDEEVEYKEAYHLLRRGLMKVRELLREEEIIGLVTNLGLTQLSRRRGVENLLHQMADRVVRIRPTRGGLLLSLPEEDRSMTFTPVPPSQSILDDFLHVGVPQGPVRSVPMEAARGRSDGPRQAEISLFR